jgi:hypothetical protein
MQIHYFTTHHIHELDVYINRRKNKLQKIKLQILICFTVDMRGCVCIRD